MVFRVCVCVCVCVRTHFLFFIFLHLGIKDSEWRGHSRTHLFHFIFSHLGIQDSEWRGHSRTHAAPRELGGGATRLRTRGQDRFDRGVVNFKKKFKKIQKHFKIKKM